MDNYKSEQYKKNSHPAKKDFIEFAKRIGVTASRIEKLLIPFLEKQTLVETLIKRSFLNESNKRGYLMMYEKKRNYLIS